MIVIPSRWDLTAMILIAVGLLSRENYAKVYVYGTFEERTHLLDVGWDLLVDSDLGPWKVPFSGAPYWEES